MKELATRKVGSRILAGACVAVVTCLSGSVLATRLFDGDVAERHRDEPLRPLPRGIEPDAGKVVLGRMLFHETRLSGDDTVACANCHPLDQGGADGLPRSIGVGGAVGDINTPTVLNSGFNFVQFWDGRAPTLEDQIDGPVNHSKEMASSWPQVIGKLRADPEYATRFTRLYPDGITADTVKDAIATFERSLVTTNNPFDRYLRGDDAAISESQKAGYKLFKSYGCVSCHQGRMVGANLYEKMGVLENYFQSQSRPLSQQDFGRFNVTGKEEHRYEFKVPSLRNVEMTAPYFHDGSAVTLVEAVKIMARYQLGRSIPNSDADLIADFLRSLTGKVDEARR